MADLTLEQLLKDHARRTREVAGEIQQPARKGSILFQFPKEDDKELREIERQLVSVADAIDRYLNQHPGR
jgi:hypothetical protein